MIEISAKAKGFLIQWQWGRGEISPKNSRALNPEPGGDAFHRVPIFPKTNEFGTRWNASLPDRLGSWKGVFVAKVSYLCASVSICGKNLSTVWFYGNSRILISL